jgi:regulator of protease activity HflC (stomatin/prohibitin superfamily)
MNKLIATLLTGLFASSVFAQATNPTTTAVPATPSAGITSGTSATIDTPVTNADVKANAKIDKADAKAEEKAAKADAKAEKKIAKAEAKAKKTKAKANADAAEDKADAVK